MLKKVSSQFLQTITYYTGIFFVMSTEEDKESYKVKRRVSRSETLQRKRGNIKKEKLAIDRWIKLSNIKDEKIIALVKELDIDLEVLEALPSNTVNDVMSSIGIDPKSRLKLLSSIEHLKIEVLNEQNKASDAVAALTMTFEEKLYWPKAIIIATTVCMAPSFIIGGANALGFNLEEGNYQQSLLYCTIPACIMFLLLGYLNGFLSLIFVRDLIANADKVDLKIVMESLLTNSGIVSALVLTVVTTSLQAAQPTETSSSLINQWYIAFLCLACKYTLQSHKSINDCTNCFPYFFIE